MNTEPFFVITGNNVCGVQGFHSVGGGGFRPCRMLHHVSMCIVTDVFMGPSASILSVVIDRLMWLKRKTHSFVFVGTVNLAYRCCRRES